MLNEPRQLDGISNKSGRSLLTDFLGTLIHSDSKRCLSAWNYRESDLCLIGFWMFCGFRETGWSLCLLGASSLGRRSRSPSHILLITWQLPPPSPCMQHVSCTRPLLAASSLFSGNPPLFPCRMGVIIPSLPSRRLGSGQLRTLQKGAQLAFEPRSSSMPFALLCPSHSVDTFPFFLNCTTFACGMVQSPRDWGSSEKSSTCFWNSKSLFLRAGCTVIS